MSVHAAIYRYVQVTSNIAIESLSKLFLQHNKSILMFNKKLMQLLKNLINKNWFSKITHVGTHPYPTAISVHRTVESALCPFVPSLTSSPAAISLLHLTSYATIVFYE